MSRLALVLATFGSVGYFPIAPGTAGSLAGLALYGILRAVGISLIDIAAIVFLTLAGIWSATRAEALLGRSDPGPVVIDEVVGMLVSLALLPVGFGGAVIGFVLFRVFDVIKPWPAGRLEGLSGGLGIMSDDVMAGVYVNVALRCLGFVAPGWVY
jgi:phosphatidylglycerophosphatase A